MVSPRSGVNPLAAATIGTVSTSFPLDGARVKFAGDTNIGRKRDHNEDSIAMPETGERLAIVCDGMGGLASGEVASRLAVELIVDHFSETGKQQTLTWPYKVDRDMRKDVNRMVTGIMLANLEIWERSQREARFKGMGTTCVALYFLDDHLIIGHVGDSRCYRVRGPELVQLTEDHSLINDYIRMKRVTPEEAENWPHKNVIVRALGMKESVQVDIITQQPKIGDTYLLCSDGLTGMIKDDQIQHILMTEKDLDRACARLIEAANEEGGVDNISCVLARVEAS
jgi:serine/threonine protein phosphatase PrpC